MVLLFLHFFRCKTIPKFILFNTFIHYYNCLINMFKKICANCLFLYQFSYQFTLEHAVFSTRLYITIIPTTIFHEKILAFSHTPIRAQVDDTTMLLTLVWCAKKGGAVLVLLTTKHQKRLTYGLIEKSQPNDPCRIF